MDRYCLIGGVLCAVGEVIMRHNLGDVRRPGKTRAHCVLHQNCIAQCSDCPVPRVPPRFQRKGRASMCDEALEQIGLIEIPGGFLDGPFEEELSERADRRLAELFPEWWWDSSTETNIVPWS